MDNNVYHLVPDHLPSDTVKCLAELLRAARGGVLTGIAFVAFVQDHGFIADAAGEAHENPTLTRGMLNALNDKMALRIGDHH